MKALLRMYYYMLGGWKVLLFYAVIFILISFLTAHNHAGFFLTAAFITALPFAGTPVGIRTAEAQCRWRSYMKALPITPEQYVDANYLFSLLSAGAAGLLTAFAVTVQMLRHPELSSAFPFAPSAAEILLMCTAISAAMVLLTAAFLCPLHFQRSGGILTYLAAMPVGLLLLFAYIASLAQLTQGLNRCKWEPLPPLTRLLPYLLLALAIVCFPLSRLLSRRLYCRKRKGASA